MNLGNEVIVKNFHVLTSNHSVAKFENDGKVYFKITDGANAENNLTTDQFNPKMIKRIRLTCPTAPVFKKWEISAPTLASGTTNDTYSDKNGLLFTVYMHFTNLYGYGLTDRWEKFATIKATVVKPNTINQANVTSANNTAKADFVTKLAAMINNQYILGMKPIVAVADTTNYKVVITDNTYTMQAPNRRRMEYMMDPQPIEMWLSTNILENADASWCNEVATAAAAGKQYKGVANTDQVYKNDYLIWGLEKVSQMKSTMPMPDPCSGFIGWDSIMDTQTLNTKTYWVLDIAYETLPIMGVPSARNLKELSLAAAVASEDSPTTPPSVLTTILNSLGFNFDSTTGKVSVPEAYSDLELCTLTLTSNDTSKGTVEGSGVFVKGSVVTIKATAETGHTFTTWSDTDADDATDAEREITLTENTTLTATFA